MLNKLKNLIRPDWKKGLAGLAVAAAIMLTCYAQATKKALLLAVVCVVLGFVKLNIRSDRVKRVLIGVLTVPCAALAFYFPLIFLNEVGFGQNIFTHFYWEWYVYLNNYLIIFIVYVLIFLICGRWKTSVAVGTTALGILSLINGLIYQFRGRELIFADIFSVGTALNVASQYTPHLEVFMYFCMGICAALILAMSAVPAPEKKTGKRGRLAALAVELVMILTLVTASADLFAWTWAFKGTRRNNYYLNFYMSFRDSFVEKPEAYSPEALALMEQDYPDPEQSAGADLPNVIVIMSEAYADFRDLFGELATNQPVTPFFDSIEENAIRGRVAVSIFGGNTANTEFEFLTGHSMAFLPDGVIPYQLYMKEEVYSLPWLMSSLGYDTFATHPYLSSGWSRTTAYPRMGFDGYSFDEDYPQENIIREYVSDQEMFEYVLQKLENKGEAPLFLFGVTMQNHGGYDYEGDMFEQTIRIEDDEPHPAAEQYLSLLNQSDKAMEYLITELEDYPEDTILVFFGDHFPSFDDNDYMTIRESYTGDLNQEMKNYFTPFLIWANFDIEEQTAVRTSISYLSRYLLEVAGIELPPYYQFLKELEAQIPVINALGYYSVSRQTYLPISEAEGEEARWLNKYAVAQYNNLIDGENRNDDFFGRYLEKE